MVGLALRFGLKLDDLKDMNVATLINILDSMQPEEHKPTQQEIDLIV